MEKGERTLVSIVGRAAKIDGKFNVSESIEIDCEVTGELKIGKNIVIQEKGFVSADVNTVDAQIIGKFNGSMRASGKIEITETGKVDGKIKTDSLIINEGGVFSGNVTRITKDEDEIKIKDKKKKSKPKNKKKSGIRVKKVGIKKGNKAKIVNIGIGDKADLKF